jgi:hypothetical protein
MSVTKSAILAAEPIYGFADSGGWQRLGNRVVGRARDSSYKEAVRSSVPIEYFLDMSMAESEPLGALALGSMDSPVDSREDKIPEYWSSIICEEDGLTEKDDYDISECREDMYDEPLVTHNHRRPARSAHKKRTPKHEPKAQKIPSRLNRGKLRCVVETPYETRAEVDWEEMCDRVIDTTIWEELRCPGSCSPKYTYKDYDSIIRRFRSKLDRSIHPTSKDITKFWQDSKSAILADYTPLRIIIPEPRYFNGLFYEYLDNWDWDWEWIDERSLRIYW